MMLITLLAAPALAAQSPRRVACEAAGGTFVPSKGGGACKPAAKAATPTSDDPVSRRC
ncbi:hypothetical protein AB5I41_30885 [Sphingomonas sp. MMS24-JH45]